MANRWWGELARVFSMLDATVEPGSTPGSTPDSTPGSAPGSERTRDDLRYEIKLMGEELMFGEIASSLSLHSAGFRPLFPPRRVQSLYFDTHTARALADNLAGVSERSKLRFRWYGDATRGVRGALELKVRENLLGWKDRESVDRVFDLEGHRRRTFPKELARDASPRWQARLSAGVEVVQWISYVREYFASADRRLRVTVDRELEAFDQRSLVKLSRRFPNLMPRVVVVECKAAPGDHLLLREFIGTFPLLVDKCSKFVLASAPVHGPLPSVFPR